MISLRFNHDVEVSVIVSYIYIFLFLCYTVASLNKHQHQHYYFYWLRCRYYIHAMIDNKKKFLWKLMNIHFVASIKSHLLFVFSVIHIQITNKNNVVIVLLHNNFDLRIDLSVANKNFVHTFLEMLSISYISETVSQTF